MRKLKYLIILLSVNIFSYEGEIYKVGSNVVKVGDEVELNLETSEDLEVEELRKTIDEIESKFGSFYILEVKKHSEKKFKLFGIYESALNSQQFKVGENIFKVNEPTLYSREQVKKIQEFHVFQKKIKKETKFELKPWMVFSFLTIVGLFIGLYLFKNNKNRKSLEEINELKKQWRLSLDKAKTREDFEEIYKGKKSIKKLFKIEKSSFFDELNKVQYKKNWDETDLQKITKSFNSFRRNL